MPEERTASTPEEVFDQEQEYLKYVYGFFDAEIEKAREAILEVLSQEKILSHDKLVFVEELANSNIVIGIQFYVLTPDYLPMKRLVLEQIKNKFDETGITIPFEQIDVHMV